MTASPLANSVTALETMLAASATFQERVGGAAEAAGRIYLIEFEAVPAEIHAARPFALIYPEQTDWVLVSASPADFMAAGTLVLQLTDANRHPGLSREDRRASAVNFLQWAGAVMEEILDAAGDNSNLVVRRCYQKKEQDGPFRSPTELEQSQGSYWWTNFRIEWGDAG